jgi:PilZ domain
MTRDSGTGKRRRPRGKFKAAPATAETSHARKWPRLRRRCRVLVRGIPAFTVDLSGGGFSTELLRVLPPGSELEGILSIDGKDLPFSGRVVWARAGAPYAGLRGRIGVTFTNAPAEVRELGNYGPVLSLFRAAAQSWMMPAGERHLSASS